MISEGLKIQKCKIFLGGHAPDPLAARFARYGETHSILDPVLVAAPLQNNYCFRRPGSIIIIMLAINRAFSFYIAAPFLIIA